MTARESFTFHGPALAWCPLCQPDGEDAPACDWCPAPAVLAIRDGDWHEWHDHACQAHAEDVMTGGAITRPLS